MQPGQHVDKYQIVATLRGGTVEWHLLLQTEDGEQHNLTVRDGEEIPILLKLLLKDSSMYFNPQSGALSTGWNDPGD